MYTMTIETLAGRIAPLGFAGMVLVTTVWLTKSVAWLVAPAMTRILTRYGLVAVLVAVCRERQRRGQRRRVLSRDLDWLGWCISRQRKRAIKKQIGCYRDTMRTSDTVWEEAVNRPPEPVPPLPIQPMVNQPSEPAAPPVIQLELWPSEYPAVPYQPAYSHQTEDQADQTHASGNQNISVRMPQ